MSGKVVHFEIPVDDGDRAVGFYHCGAFGWELERWESHGVLDDRTGRGRAPGTAGAHAEDVAGHPGRGASQSTCRSWVRTVQTSRLSVVTRQRSVTPASVVTGPGSRAEACRPTRVSDRWPAYGPRPSGYGGQ